MNALKTFPQELRDTLREMLAEGWTIEHGKKHEKLVSPNGRRRLPLPRAKFSRRPHALKNYLKTLLRARKEAGGPS